MSAGRNSSKSGLFLIELIVAIVFFAVASANCIQLFVGAHMLSKSSSDLNMAVTVAQNTAECFKLTGGSVEELSALLSGEPGADGKTLTVYYDGSWQSTSRENAKYHVFITLGGTERLPSAMIAVSKQPAGELVYEITAEKYMP